MSQPRRAFLVCLLGFAKVSQSGRVGDSCHMRLNEEDVGGDWMIWAGRGCLGGGCRSQKVRSGVGSRSFLEKGGREGRGGWRFKSAKLGWGERGGKLYVKVVYVPKRCSKKICSQQGRGGSEMKTMHITGQKLINTPENRSVKLSEKWRNQCIC